MMMVVVSWNPSTKHVWITSKWNYHHHHHVSNVEIRCRMTYEQHSDNTSAMSTNVDDDNTICIPVPQYVVTKESSLFYPSRLHFIYMEPLLSSEEAQRCYQLAQQYGVDRWRRPDEERHINFPTCDFPIYDDDAPDFASYLNSIQFTERVLQRMTHHYFPSYLQDIDDDIQDPPLLGFMDLFCVQYVATDDCENNQRMDRLEAHRDGSILSFTILLSPPENFKGGGTFFDALMVDTTDLDSDDTRGVIQPPAAGYAVYHSGKLLHGAKPVLQGHRTILVGFVDVADHVIQPGAERQACTTLGRLDVAMRRAAIQEQQRQQQQQQSTPKSQRFLPNYSCLRTIIPSFQAPMLRAQPEFQRRKRLEAEDLYLRSLLMDDSSDEYIDEHFLSIDDISIV
jgi:hypothetical protein